jgi:hypothetical protein
MIKVKNEKCIYVYSYSSASQIISYEATVYRKYGQKRASCHSVFSDEERPQRSVNKVRFDVLFSVESAK